MKPSELQEKTCHQFDCAIKTVIRHRAIDFYRAIRRSEKKEMPFAEIMDDLLNSIGTEDTYSTDYVALTCLVLVFCTSLHSLWNSQAFSQCKCPCPQ